MTAEVIVVDGDQMLVNATFGERLVPRRVPEAPRFRLTVEGRKAKAIEAKCPEMAPLLELTDQLEQLGYQFVRLERITEVPL